MKKLILSILTVAIFVTSLIGCGDMGNTGELKLSELEETTELNLTFVTTVDGIQINFSCDNTIIHFQNKFPKVRLNIKRVNMADYGGEEKFYKATAAEIMAGKGADIILIDRLFARNNDVYKMAKAGAFFDMANLIETDPDFKKADLSMAAIEGARMDSKQYIIPLSYHIPLFFSTEEALKIADIDKTKLNNVDNLIDELTKHYSDEEAQSVEYLFTYLPTYRSFYKYMGFDLIDYTNSKLNIDDPFFKKSLEFWKLVYSVEKSKPNDNSANLISKDNRSDNFAMLFSDMLIPMWCKDLIYDLDEIGTPIVIPWRDNDSKISALSNDGMAIASNSKNIKNAWEFIKVCLDADTSAQKNPLWIPVNKNAMRSAFPKQPSKCEEDYLSLQDDIKKVNFYSPIDKIERKLYEDYADGKIDYDTVVKELKSTLEIYVSE